MQALEGLTVAICELVDDASSRWSSIISAALPTAKNTPPKIGSANPKMATVTRIGIFTGPLYIASALARLADDPEAEAVLAASNCWK
jgi:hypothetical protein